MNVVCLFSKYLGKNLYQVCSVTARHTIYFCQAQPKLQVKQSLKAELALILFPPATARPPVRNSTEKAGSEHNKLCNHPRSSPWVKNWKITSILGGNGRYFIILGNGRWPQLLAKWEKTKFWNWRQSNLFSKIWENPNFLGKRKRPQLLKKMEDNLNFSGL